MNIEFECRRCAGRGRRPEEDQDCYVCGGDGWIRVNRDEVHNHLVRRDQRTDK